MRLYGLLTLIAITNGNLVGLMNLKMRENVMRFEICDILLSNTSCSRIVLEQERTRQYRSKKTCDVMLGACPC